MQTDANNNKENQTDCKESSNHKEANFQKQIDQKITTKTREMTSKQQLSHEKNNKDKSWTMTTNM